MPDDNEYLWNPAPPRAPDPEIVRLENALRPYRLRPRDVDWSAIAPPRSMLGRRLAPLAAAAVLLIAVAVLWRTWNAPSEGWRVQRVSGGSRVAAAPLAGDGRLGVGEALSTDDASTASIAVGRIGTAEIGPGSRVRLVRSSGTEHRLALDEGSMHARIWAPPRFFLVETPSALAVDLGCVYTLEVDAQGVGVLAVQSGQVELVQRGRRSLVTAGTAAALRPASGPGTPFPVASSPEFRAALATLDAGARDSAALDIVLREGVGQGTISLWHLLARVEDDARARVYDRLAFVSPPPRGVTRNGVLELDRRMLSRWRSALEPTWSNEKVALWRKMWRTLWSSITEPDE